MGKTLRLLVDSYDQRVSSDRDADLLPRRKGDLFEARNQAEYDRLTALGVAEDPDQVQEEAREELERRREALEAERARIDEELGRVSASDPSQLKGKELDAALEARGLSTDGKADEKRARLATAIEAEAASPTPPA